MPCYLTVYDLQAKTKQTYTCDEDNAARVIEDEHTAGGSGEYADVQGKPFKADWTRHRLIAFKRER
jgi:hypothetical protein